MAASPASFAIQPDSLRQRVLRVFTDDTQRSAPDVARAMGMEPQLRSHIAPTLHMLAEDGFLAKVGTLPRDGNFGRPWRTFVRVPEAQTAEQRRFAEAKRIVEAAGWVLVPRRVG